MRQIAVELVNIFGNVLYYIHIKSTKMRNNIISICFACIPALLIFSQCSDTQDKDKTDTPTSKAFQFGGFNSQEEWGEHLVTIGTCNDCHTPKKMTAHGPEIDSSLLLSGHPANEPPPDIDRKEIESKGLIVASTLTSFVGPWGISYAANLSSDATGIGGWQESNFITALREGKFKGLPSGRPLLPPMPWQMYKHMTDDELKAIFAYLKSTKPINNVVPPPAPPVSAAK